MSGHGWQDPYDPYNQRGPQPPQQPAGWQDPYTYGPPGVPQVAAAGNGSALGALIVNIVLTITCCGLLAIPGIVTSAIAMGRVRTDPESARNLTTWSWVIAAINVVIVIAVVIIYIALYASNNNP